MEPAGKLWSSLDLGLLKPGALDQEQNHHTINVPSGSTWPKPILVRKPTGVVRSSLPSPSTFVQPGCSQSGKP